VWARQNAVEFDVAKMEAILFSRKRWKPDRTIDVGDGIKVPCNKGATQWLGFWLDSEVNFKEHYPKRMAKAREMEKNISRLHGKYGMTPANVRKVTTTVIQALALFGLEVWWRGQQTRADEVQRMFNRQA
jgi:hypothetical protein